VNVAVSTDVSVLVAAYQAEGHLERAVRSALEQTAPPREVVVVDDASTDGTLAVARALAARDPRVRVVALTENGGPARARNAAIEVARGRWLAVLDADDMYSPGRLQAMVDVAERHAADVVVDNFVFRSERTGALRPSRIPAGDGDEPVTLHRFLDRARAFNREPTWTLLKPLLRRDFLERHGLRYPTDVRHGEDFLLMVEALVAGARCVRQRRPGYLYTERARGLSTTRLDYTGLVRTTERLLADPRLDDDPVARRLLVRRLATLRCLVAERSGRIALVASAARDAGVAGTLARRAARRASRAVVRPRPDPVPALL
jgi:succinoglycan biosynthesis protein ExoO